FKTTGPDVLKNGDLFFVAAPSPTGRGRFSDYSGQYVFGRSAKLTGVSANQSGSAGRLSKNYRRWSIALFHGCAAELCIRWECFMVKRRTSMAAMTRSRSAA